MDWLLPAAVVGGSALGALGSFLGGRQQADASRDAANMAMAATEPQRRAASTALGIVTPAIAQPFATSPGYQFRLDEGMRAINNQTLSQGMYGSGARGRAMQRYAQGVAAAEYGDWVNRLLALAGLGTTATQGSIAAAAPLVANAGAAQGGGLVGATNAIGGGINNLIALNQMQNNDALMRRALGIS